MFLDRISGEFLEFESPFYQERNGPRLPFMPNHRDSDILKWIRREIIVTNSARFHEQSMRPFQELDNAETSETTPILI